MHVGVWWGKPREGDNLQGSGVNGKILLKQIFNNWDEGKDWIDVAQDRNTWRVFVNAVMNLCLPRNALNFLTI